MLGNCFCCCSAAAPRLTPTPSLLEIWISGSSGAWANDRPGVLIDWRCESLVAELCCNPSPCHFVHWNQLRVMWDGAAGRRHRFLLESRVAVEVALCWVMLVQQLRFDEWVDGGILVCQRCKQGLTTDRSRSSELPGTKTAGKAVLETRSQDATVTACPVER